MSLSTFFSNVSTAIGNSVKDTLNAAKASISKIIGNVSNGFTSLWDGGFAGISEAGFESLYSSLETYISDIETMIKEFNNKEAFDSTFKGETVIAVDDYIESVQTLLSAYTSRMRLSLSDARTAHDAYITQTDALSQNITSDADDLREQANKINLDLENGAYLAGTGNLAKSSTSNDSSEKNFFQTVADAYASTAATVAVFTTSVASGLSRVVEIVGDGVVYAVGGISAGFTWVGDQLFGTDNAGKVLDATFDFARRDLVGEANEYFYENTAVGQAINDASYMKYDSELAQGIQDVSETAGKIVVATAATVVTGGAGAAAIGALYGLGNTMNNYTTSVDRENGEGYEYGKAYLKGAAGAVAGAAEFYGYGKMGSALLNAGKTVATNTVVTSASKNFGINFKNAFDIKDTLIDTAAVVSDHGVNCAVGDETLEEALKNTAKEGALAVGLNVLSASISSVKDIKIANGDAITKLSLSDNYLNYGNQVDFAPGKFFTENIDYFNSKNMSFDDFMSSMNLNYTSFNVANATSAYASFDDSTMYIYQKLKDAGVSVNQPGSYSIDDLIDLGNQNKIFDANDIDTLNSIRGNSLKELLTDQQNATVYQYTRAGGCNVCNYMRGDESISIEQIESWMNDFQLNNDGVMRTQTNNIIQEMTDIINTKTNSTSIQAVRYVNDLGPNVNFNPNDVSSLIGQSFDDKAFGSFTLLSDAKTAYSDSSIKMIAHIDKGSGALIQGSSGLRGNISEFLVKPNYTTTIVDAYQQVDPTTNKTVTVLETLVSTVK